MAADFGHLGDAFGEDGEYSGDVLMSGALALLTRYVDEEVQRVGLPAWWLPVMAACRIAFAACLLAPLSTAGPVVRTESGLVEGTVMTSLFKNKTYFAFRGMPYAQPPIGELRFEAPQPPKPWEGTWDATKDGSICIQDNVLVPVARVIQGSEDCLFINVYTPKIPEETPNPKNSEALLPVVVYIHGGGLFAMSSISNEIGPDYMLDSGEIILVTMNYRLGFMGFLSSGTDDLPGNLGFKDQTAALRWVRENIEHFGGNPAKVTIMGQSAGGASVHMHLLSPLSRGLFHRAISLSGVALDLWVTPAYDPKWSFNQVCILLGCATDNITAAVHCLKTVDASKIVASMDDFKVWSIDPMNVVGYSVEKISTKNPAPFLTDKPQAIIEKGLFAKVPFIIGTVPNEGLIRAGVILATEELRTNLSQNFDTLMPILMGLEMTTKPSDIPALWKDIKDFYFKGKNYLDIKDSENVAGFINLYSDRSFLYYIYVTALMHNKVGHTPVYFYNFNYAGINSFANLFSGLGSFSDINFKFEKAHCDDLLYLFRSPAWFKYEDLPPNHPDRQMKEIMTRLITDFASGHHFEVPWEPLPLSNGKLLGNSEFRFLNITSPTDIRMNTNYHTERMAFWQKRDTFPNL